MRKFESNPHQMSRIFNMILIAVFFCAAPCADANKCSGVTCGYGGQCVTGKDKSGKDKYTCIKCRYGYQGGDNKQCTVNLAPRKVNPKLKPLDQGLRIKKPRGGDFLKKIYKQVPSDLKKCVAKSCDMCEKKDQKACVLCDDKTFLSEKQCVAKCPAKTYATNKPKSGRICAPCSSADERYCSVVCDGYRWEKTECIEGCKLPARFGKDYLAGTCQPGKLLAKGGSCELKCASHAFKAGSAAIQYKCSAAGSMLTPSSRCETSWTVYSKREGNDLGLLYTSLVLDWTSMTCDSANGFKKLKKGVDSYGHVGKALAGLNMPRGDFTPSCRKGTNFRQFPKFTLTSKKDYTLLDGALAIKQPVFYFDNVGPRKKWQITMRGTGSFKIQDGTTITSTVVGTYRPKAQIWTITWLATKKWSTPFKVSWLEINEAAAVAQVSAANVTSLGMSGNCVASLEKKEFSQRCTMDLLAKKWLLKLNFNAEMSAMQHIVAKFSKFGVADLGLMTSLDAHGVITMYVADTPQSVGYDQIAEGVTVIARTKFVQEDPLMKLAAGLRIRHTSFTTRFTVGHFAKTPAKPTLTFKSFSNHTIVKYWAVSNFGFSVDLQAAKFVFQITGKLMAAFGPGTLVMKLTGSVTKDAVPTKLMAVADRWRDCYGHVGLDLVDVKTTCDVTQIHLPVFSMVAKLPIGDAVVPMSGTVVAAMRSKIYLTGTIAKLSIKQMRAFMSRVLKTKAISDASDAIVFPDNQVTVSSRSGHVIIDGKETYVYRGLYIKTKSQLGGLPTNAAISYNSKNAKRAAMYVSFPNPVALNALILKEGATKMRDAVADLFALNLKDSAHKDLISGLQILDFKNLVPIAEEVALAPWSIAHNTSMVSLEVEWQGRELLYNLPALFTTQQSSKLITELLSMLKFGCRTNNDCTGKAVCSHAVIEGDFHPLYSTWQCVATCRKGIEFNHKDAGCFQAVHEGDKCWGDAVCTTGYCPKGKCVVRKNNGDQCNPDVPEACDSKYCCTMCGTTCEEYPLKSGFNCTKDADCKSGWCREKQEPSIKSCSQLLKKGDKCEVNSNCKSKYCSKPQKNKCTTQSQEGGKCFFADECVSGLSCCFECAFTCQKYPRKNGLGCLANADCTSKFCHAGKCVSEIPDGGKCTSDKLCGSGYCSKVQGNTCVRKAADGGKCGLDDDCKSDYCAKDQGKVCFTLIANGNKCASDVQCESGFCNNLDAKGKEVKDKATWKCAAKLESKKECKSDRMCKSGKCSVCSWWVCSCS